MTAPASTPIGSSDFFAVYATPTGADIDLVAASAVAGSFPGTPCRAIRANAAGNIAIKRARDGATVILPFLAGETQEVQATAIVNATTTVACAVFW